jgi:SAM-dependent methyltransferase
MKRTESVTVVLPIYGVQDGVDAVIRDLAVAAYALQTRGLSLSVLLLDDGHRDVGKKAAKNAAEFGLDASVVSDVKTAGAAFIEGYRLALADESTDVVVTLDATGQHDATQIPGLIDLMINRNLDAVIGSRWARHSGTPGLTMRRWAAAKLANAAFRQVTRVRGLTDATTTFRVIRADALRQLHLDGLPSDLYGIQMAIVAELVARGYRVGEGPIIYRAPAKPLRPVTAGGAASFANHLVRLRRYANDVRRHRLSPAGRQFSHELFDAALDLEQLGTADRFFGWTLEEFEGHLDGTVLEVGAGNGTITRKLVEARPSLSVVALEPAGNVYRDLASYAAVSKRVTAHQKTTEEYLSDDEAGGFDAVLYLNVLEHIEDEDHELRLAYQALRPGGALLVFGPALERLYSELDFNAGHYRRYSVDGLRKAVEGAGFQIVSARYFDVLGVLPYFLVYRVLRRPAISGSTMWGYDRVLVPVSRFLQNVLRKPPLGKNVILVARKPA